MTAGHWRRSGVGAAAVAALLFVWSWLFRYNDFDGPVAGLTDDHFYYLVRGWQLLYGEWPDRDFVDPGAPLTFVLEALTQIVGGRGTWSEIVFCVTALSTATVLTFWAARRVSGSTAIATLAALFQASLLPRYYNYPKVLAYAVALPLLWAYVDRPSAKKRLAMAALSVVALLLRHDHGLFLGLACAGTILLQSHVEWRSRIRQLASYVLLTVVIALPYLGWVQLNGGVVAHVRAANSYSQRDRERAPLILPEFALSARADNDDHVEDEGAWWQRGVFVYATRNYEPWLFWLIVAVPLMVLAAQAGRFTPRDNWPHARQKILVIALLGLVLIWGFVRGNLSIRFGDVSVTTAVLSAWLLGATVRFVRKSGPVVPRAAAACVALALVAGTVLVVTPSMRRHLDQAGMVDSRFRVIDRVRMMTARLVTWPLEQWTAPDAPGAIRLAFYMRDCTAGHERTFISPYLSFVHALAQRPFPAGHGDLRPGFYSAPEDQQLALDRLQRQQVPLVVMPTGNDYTSVQTAMPRIDAWVRAEFDEFGDVDLGNGTSVKLFARRGRAAGVWRQTGWPCFTS
ncbi:MAG: hypothetical protein ABL986_23495 [Vicinamibacterales bacterium]